MQDSVPAGMLIDWNKQARSSDVWVGATLLSLCNADCVPFQGLLLSLALCKRFCVPASICTLGTTCCRVWASSPLQLQLKGLSQQQCALNPKP